jgi:hypothetical protein
MQQPVIRRWRRRRRRRRSEPFRQGKTATKTLLNETKKRASG